MDDALIGDFTTEGQVEVKQRGEGGEVEEAQVGQPGTKEETECPEGEEGAGEDGEGAVRDLFAQREVESGERGAEWGECHDGFVGDVLAEGQVEVGDRCKGCDGLEAFVSEPVASRKIEVSQRGRAEDQRVCEGHDLAILCSLHHL